LRDHVGHRKGLAAAGHAQRLNRADRQLRR
jgi:hypothetical protein